MNRADSSPYDVSNHLDLETMDDKITFNASATSSKAVLIALRALQDKIRRLEAEKSHALDEVAQLRMQRSNVEIEYEHTRRRELLDHQRDMQNAHIAYDKLSLEKQELASRLEIMEERTSKSKQELDDLLLQMKILEDEKYTQESRLSELESEYYGLQQQLEISQQREKDLSQTMAWDAKRHQEEMEKAKISLQTVRQELTDTTIRRNDNEKRLHELDQLVGQLLSVNETLVSHLSRAPRSSSTSKSSKNRTRSNSATRLASSTVSSELKTRKLVNGFDGSMNTRTRPVKMTTGPEEADAQHFAKLHDMFVAVADTLTGDRGKSRSRDRTAHAVTDASAERSTRIRHRSASKRPSPVDSDKPVPVPVDDSRRKSADASAVAGRRSSRSDRDYLPSRSIGRPLSTTTAAAMSTPSASFSSPEKPSRDLRGVIQSLEEEFDALNNEYYRLVDVRPNDNNDGMSEAQHAEHLVTIIQQLHKKGEQIRALKSPLK